MAMIRTSASVPLWDVFGGTLHNGILFQVREGREEAVPYLDQRCHLGSC